MFFYIVLTPISTTSGLWSTGNTRKYHQIDVHIYQCDILLSKKQITKVLISLHRFSGWSGPLLLANLQRQVFSRRGPYHLSEILPNKLLTLYLPYAFENSLDQIGGRILLCMLYPLVWWRVFESISLTMLRFLKMSILSGQIKKYECFW